MEVASSFPKCHQYSSNDHGLQYYALSAAHPIACTCPVSVAADFANTPVIRYMRRSEMVSGLQGRAWFLSERPAFATIADRV